jgi:cob(I)alamin adenosyltransferase
MIKITKVYTKQGDDGHTGLPTQRYPKHHPRIVAIGSVDELNASLGWSRQALQTKHFETIDSFCHDIQQQLFNLGAMLSVDPLKRSPKMPVLTPDNITALEQDIDRMNQSLPSLKSFILPGGGEAASRLHCTRTICRRTERDMSALHAETPLENLIMAYSNRLSDWLFVAARYSAYLDTSPEALWDQT